MATRPTIPINVRASDAVYSTGVVALQGQPTKIARDSGDMAEGYKVDSPLGSQPVTAQGVNFEDNRNDLWVEWVSFGSSANGSNTHIVETDSSGDINVLGVNCADVSVVPAPGVDGIEVTATGGSKGIEVTQDATSTDYGVYVDAADGAAAPAFVAETRSNVGMLISHGSLSGLTIGSVALGGSVGPSISLTSNAIEPTSLVVGTFWNRSQNSINNVKMGMGSTAGYIVVAKHAPCYARSVGGTFVLTGSQTDQVIRPDFAFKTDQKPQATDTVRVTIWGKVSTFGGQDNIVTLKVRDKTVGGNPTICQMDIQTVETTGTSLFVQHSATFSDDYLIPATGSRLFDLVWTGNVTGASGSFTGFVEITEMRG